MEIPKVYKIKKESSNRTSYYIDTLDNLTLQLKHFLVSTEHGRKTCAPPKLPKVFTTPQELVDALNASAAYAGSSEIKYTVV